MTAAANKQPDADAEDRSESKATSRRGLRKAIARYFGDLLAPLTKRIVKHRVKVRRFGGLGALAVGVGFMAGGLGPLGLSLIFAGTAILLLDREQSRPAGSDRQPK